jgi:hypothetical protein
MTRNGGLIAAVFRAIGSTNDSDGDFMIRRLLGIATPVVALGLAAGYLQPSLFAGEGAPMLVASASSAPNVQMIGYEGAACLSDLDLNAPADASGRRMGADLLVLTRPTETFALVLRGTEPASPTAHDVIIIWSRDRIVAIRQAPDKSNPQPNAKSEPLASICAPDVKAAAPGDRI